MSMYSPNCSVSSPGDGTGTVRRLNTRSPSVVRRRTSRLVGISSSTHDVSGSPGVSVPPQTLSVSNGDPSPFRPPPSLVTAAEVAPPPRFSPTPAASSVSSDEPRATSRSQPNVASNAEFTSSTIGSPSREVTRTIGSETVSTTASNRSRRARSSRSTSSVRQASASLRLTGVRASTVSVSIGSPAVTNTNTPNPGSSNRWACVSPSTATLAGNAGSSASRSHATARG